MKHLQKPLEVSGFKVKYPYFLLVMISKDKEYRLIRTEVYKEYE